MRSPNNPAGADQAGNKVILLGPFYFKYLPAYHDPPSLGLLSLAATLRSAGFSVDVPNLNIPLRGSNDYKKLAKTLLARKPSIIGLSGWGFSYHNSVRIAEQVKKIVPDLPIVFGGPHSSTVARETMTAFPSIDLLVIGEGEPVIVDVVHALLNNRDHLRTIPGICYKDNGRVVQTRGHNMVADLASLPTPAYDLAGKTSVIPLDTGRGCPYPCTYCSTNDFFSRKPRMKPVRKVIDEIRDLYTMHHIQSFAFTHDTFTLYREQAIAFCKALKKEKLPICWSCSTRPDRLDDELITAMAGSGCEAVFLGIETGSSRMQRVIKKNLKIHRVFDIVEKCLARGLTPTCSFIIGFPQETVDDMRQTTGLYARLLSMGAEVQMTVLSPAPGTAIYDEFQDSLAFDRHFSGFSDHLISEGDVGLLQKYPKIFPTFYYAPTRHYKRQRILQITDIANHLAYYARTFRAIHVIQPDWHIDILELEKAWHKEVMKEKKDRLHDTFFSFMVTTVHEKIKEHRYFDHAAIKEIFTFDTLVASLLTKSNMERISMKRGMKKMPLHGKALLRHKPLLQHHVDIMASPFDLSILSRKRDSVYEFMQSRLSRPRYYGVVVPAIRHWNIKRLTKREAVFLALCDGQYDVDTIIHIMSRHVYRDDAKARDHILRMIRTFDTLGWLK